MEPRLLDPTELPALRTALAPHRVETIFQLGRVEAELARREDGNGPVRWLVVGRPGAPPRAATLLTETGLISPWAPSPLDASAMGHWLRRHSAQPVRAIVGERKACDALLREAAGRRPLRHLHDQLLYALNPQELQQRPPAPALDELVLRRARTVDDEVAELAVMSARMHLEDMGTDPSAGYPEAYRDRVRSRIARGEVFVLEGPRGHLWFKVDVGSASRWGAQIGGVYTRPALRGRGVGRHGMEALCAALRERLPLLTLHVRADNSAAVRLYEGLGFRYQLPFRVALL